MENSKLPQRRLFSPAESSLSFLNSSRLYSSYPTGSRDINAGNTQQGIYEKDFSFFTQSRLGSIMEWHRRLTSLRIDDDEFFGRRFRESSSSNFQLGTSNPNLSASVRRNYDMAGPSSFHNSTWNSDPSSAVRERDSDMAGPSSSHIWASNSNIYDSVRGRDFDLATQSFSHNFTSDSNLSACVWRHSDLAGSSSPRNFTSDSNLSIPLYCTHHSPTVEDADTLESLHSSNRFKQQGKRSGSLGGHLLSDIRTELRIHDIKESRTRMLDYSHSDLQICFGAKDKYESRLLCDKLHSGSPAEVEVIVQEAIPRIFDLMENPYGNDVVKKIFEVCTQDQMIRIITTLIDVPVAFVSTCKNQLGSKAVQLLIEKFKNSSQIEMVASVLNSEFMTLVNDKYGHLVLNCCLEKLQFEKNLGIIYTADSYCLDIATQRYGCLVLKNCIESSIENESGFVDRFIEKITRRGLQLAKHAYGNYVIQQIIHLKSPIANQILMSQFEGHFVDLSTTKTGAYVVEKCMETWSNRDMIVYELLSTPHFDLLMQDQFANYVISTALKLCKGRVKAELVRAIVPHKEDLRNNPHCKRIISKACNITGC